MRRLPLPLRTGRLRAPTLNRITVALALVALVTVMLFPVAAAPDLRHLFPGQFGFPAVRGVPNGGGPSGPAGTLRTFITWQGTYNPIGHYVLPPNAQDRTSPFAGTLYGSVDYNIVPSKRYVITEGDMQWDSNAISAMQSDFACYYSNCGQWYVTNMVFHTFQPTANNFACLNIDPDCG